MVLVSQSLGIECERGREVRIRRPVRGFRCLGESFTWNERIWAFEERQQ